MPEAHEAVTEAIDALTATVVAFNRSDPLAWPDDSLKTAAEALAALLVAVTGEIHAREARRGQIVPPSLN